MKLYQIYFIVLKVLVLAQVVFTAGGFEVANSPIFALVDAMFKISLGLFLAIYFWLFTPKGLDVEDGIIISIGGVLLLAEIQFGPIVKFYELREWTLEKAFSLVPGEKRT